MSNMTYIPHIALLSPPSFSCPSQTDARLSAATLPQYPDSRWDRQILTLHYSRPFLNKRSHIDSWANKYRHEWVLPQLLASLHSDAASSSFFFSPIDAVLESDSSKVLVLIRGSAVCQVWWQKQCRVSTVRRISHWCRGLIMACSISSCQSGSSQATQL